MIKRCAIYTRKSTEEGLDQAFNSLHAQRAACENFIRSQKAEGWRIIKTHYDDGGLSGGNMERPALKALLSDIANGRVDIVVVYKVDRLTRSLADFAKLVDQFDDQDVSFVSVTQQFNTSSSMGRLTLNVLLSFAQFEREVTAERIRDKITASRKKGLWTGGVPPLGYDVVDKQLVVNREEAATVKRLFEAYLDAPSARDVLDLIEEEDLRTKKRANGQGGHLITRGPLYWILSNPIYAGYVRSGDQLYDGVHEAIIDRALWHQVQTKREASAQRLGTPASAQQPLAGKLFADQRPLTPSSSIKNGRRYGYYVTDPGTPGREAAAMRWRLNAEKLEAALLSVIDDWITDVATPSEVLDQPSASHIQAASSAMKRLALKLSDKTDTEKLKFWSQRIERVEVNETGLTIKFAAPRMAADFPGLSLQEPITARSQQPISRKGCGLRLIMGETHTAASTNPGVEQLLVQANKLKQQWFTEPDKTLAEIARELGLNPADATRIIRLAFLSPALIEALLEGHATTLTQSALRRVSHIPLLWSEQEQLFA